MLTVVISVITSKKKKKNCIRSLSTFTFEGKCYELANTEGSHDQVDQSDGLDHYVTLYFKKPENYYGRG